MKMSEIRDKIIGLKKYMETKIIGQEDLVKKLIITLLADGHALVEGAPGLAKTKAIKTLARSINAAYNRIQFTPDLLPSDIIGSEIYLAAKGEFEFRPGPVFANLVLADEINRAPAKVQSALLEAMAERQVSVGGKRYELPPLFMVMATQNPIEQEGTYNLPEFPALRHFPKGQVRNPPRHPAHTDCRKPYRQYRVHPWHRFPPVQNKPAKAQGWVWSLKHPLRISPY